MKKLTKQEIKGILEMIGYILNKRINLDNLSYLDLISLKNKFKRCSEGYNKHKQNKRE